LSEVEILENKDKFLFSLFLFLSLSYLYNLLFQFCGNIDTLLFWILILSLILILLYEIFHSGMHAHYVLIQILAISVLLKLVYQVGYYGLRGSDVYFDYNFLKHILEHGGFDLAQTEGYGSIPGWPMLHLFATNFVMILEINVLTVAKYLMTIISSFVLVGIYLTSKVIYSNKKIALFSSLVFATIPKFIHFDNLFIRQTFVIVMMSLVVFLIIKYAVEDDDCRLLIVFLFLLPAIILGHHFTSFILSIFFLIYLLFMSLILKNYRVLGKFFAKTYDYINRRQDVLIKKKMNLQMLFSLFLISLVAYWLFITVNIPERFLDVMLEIFGFVEVGTPYAEEAGITDPILTVRGHIIYYGFFIFHFLFAFILLLLSFLKKDERKIENLSLTSFFYFGAFMAFLGLFFFSELITPDRFNTYMWMIGILPIVGFIRYMKKSSLKKTFTVILILFILFNIYNIPSVYIEGNPHQSGVVVGEKEYRLAESIKFPEEYYRDEYAEKPAYYTHIGMTVALYDTQGLHPRRKSRNIYEGLEQREPHEIVIIREDYVGRNIDLYEEKSEEQYDLIISILNIEEEKGTNKIYDSGNIYVVKGSQGDYH